jgi:hypothetical protein
MIGNPLERRAVRRLPQPGWQELPSLPDPCDHRAAERARTVTNVHLLNGEAVPPDDRLPAVRAEGIFALPGHIPLVDIPEAGVSADLARPLQRLQRRSRLVGELVRGMKTADMPGNVGIDRPDELGDLPKLRLRVIVSRNDECRDLGPDAEVVIEPDGIQDRLEPCAADLPVEAVGESLEVDVCRMEVGPDLPKRPGVI